MFSLVAAGFWPLCNNSVPSPRLKVTADLLPILFQTMKGSVQEPGMSHKAKFWEIKENVHGSKFIRLNCTFICQGYGEN